ncbi:MAG TPA: hypothetical protein VFK52_10720 [Nocardioidaceae bacterium]|nr:hypothetical protein [Nocardioidaceae bacterium]
MTAVSTSLSIPVTFELPDQAAPPSSGSVQSWIDLIGPNPAGVTMGTNGGTYAWPGDALSASVAVLLGNVANLRPVVFARWVLVWTPGNVNNGVRLVSADSGPTNIVQISEDTGDSTATPIVHTATITDDLNAIIAADAFKNIGYQVKVSAAFEVYQSRLELVWK